MIYKVTDPEGNLLRHGICQEADLPKQAREGEIASETTEEEIAKLKAAAAGEVVVPPAEGEEKPTKRPPIDPLAVVVRALRNAGVTLDLPEARQQLTQEIDAKERDAAAARDALAAEISAKVQQAEEASAKL